jgi:hypothetical protein
VKFKTPDEYTREFIENWIKNSIHHKMVDIKAELITDEIREELTKLGYDVGNPVNYGNYGENFVIIRWK